MTGFKAVRGPVQAFSEKGQPDGQQHPKHQTATDT
jgi:hypothetical protein